jgi:predicted metal-dependent enzyme (double-stranded beta helix superfamily)
VAVVEWDRLIERCVDALEDSDPLGVVADLVAATVADPQRLASTVVPPLDPADDGVVYRSDDLLIVNVVFPGGFATGIHDHRVPAVIGAWAGHEDNLLYRRRPSGLEYVGGRRLEPGEVLTLAEDAVHDVHAPAASWCGALHVYLGDLGVQARSEWPSIDGLERACDAEDMERRWLEAAIATDLVTSEADDVADGPEAAGSQ